MRAYTEYTDESCVSWHPMVSPSTSMSEQLETWQRPRVTEDKGWPQRCSMTPTDTWKPKGNLFCHWCLFVTCSLSNNSLCMSAHVIHARAQNKHHLVALPPSTGVVWRCCIPVCVRWPGTTLDRDTFQFPYVRLFFICCPMPQIFRHPCGKARLRQQRCSDRPGWIRSQTTTSSWMNWR